MQHYNRLAKNHAQLLFFCADYPLAPEQKHPVQVESILSAYRWLVDHVGVRNIVLGGDSAGANLQILLHKQLIRDQTANPLLILPKSMVLVSPWLDVSLSHTPPHILSSLATSSDLLPFSMLETWRDNATPHGVNPRDPKISPFFDLSPFIMPVDGILLIYGSTEIFAPEIDDWVKSIRREKDVRSKLKIILGVDMPHVFPLVLHFLPGCGNAKANRALYETAKFIFQSSNV
ncbi:Alpha/Beta hydrolase protein [Globomyces pollinis-pini]|nr:Alpha/Beta hydrolase protein [Globomyces pollinis-pini]